VYDYRADWPFTASPPDRSRGYGHDEQETVSEHGFGSRDYMVFPMAYGRLQGVIGAAYSVEEIWKRKLYRT